LRLTHDSSMPMWRRLLQPRSARQIASTLRRHSQRHEEKRRKKTTGMPG
jgi:hypothetical protein